MHGVKGWVKIYSETAPIEKIFEYSPWLFVDNKGEGGAGHKVASWQKKGKGLIANLEGIEDRDQAMALIGTLIEVSVDQFETLEDGDYYWFQLQGLEVESLYEGQRHDLGIVEKLMETGANDVMVVRSTEGTERLVPWTPGQHVLRVDLEAGKIEVNWDPDF